jgi:phosphoribosylamine--glycine ligase
VARILGLDDARLPATPAAAVGIVLAAAGYPGSPRRGDPIDGLDAAGLGDTLVFHAGTERDGEGAWRTNGGRVLTVVGRGPDLAAAREAAEAAAARIAWPGLQRRTDIAASLPSAPVAPVAPVVAGSAG